MRIAWLLLLLPLAANAQDRSYELFLAGAGDSLEVTLVSHAPLPLVAANVSQWLHLPAAANCRLLDTPLNVAANNVLGNNLLGNNAPANEADKPMMHYVWQFRCGSLADLTELTFNAKGDENEDGGKLYLQWVLPTSQGKVLLDEPVTAFDFSAANQAGGIL